jgi:hypothetical protein
MLPEAPQGSSHLRMLQEAYTIQSEQGMKGFALPFSNVTTSKMYH